MFMDSARQISRVGKKYAVSRFFLGNWADFSASDPCLSLSVHCGTAVALRRHQSPAHTQDAHPSFACPICPAVRSLPCFSPP